MPPSSTVDQASRRSGGSCEARDLGRSNRAQHDHLNIRERTRRPGVGQDSNLPSSGSHQHPALPLEPHRPGPGCATGSRQCLQACRAADTSVSLSALRRPDRHSLPHRAEQVPPRHHIRAANRPSSFSSLELYAGVRGWLWAGTTVVASCCRLATDGRVGSHFWFISRF